MKYWLALLCALIAVPAFAQPPRTPPGQAKKTTIRHAKYHGGDLHEAETDGQTDGLVFWKNGTCQEMHNGRLGKWCAPFHPEAPPARPPASLPPADVTIVPPPADGGTVTVDNFVYVSPQQVAAWGGMTTTINKVTVAVDLMNDSFLHAGINAQQRIVGIDQYDQNEGADWGSTFSAFASRVSSGAFNALRETTGWDTISLFITQTQYCGQAYVFYPSIPMEVLNGNCAAGQLSYAHECGHTMGLMHNAGDTGYAAICGPTAVGYGTSAFRTPMSYLGGPRTPQYSAPSPAVWFKDGISPVGTAQTDATSCINKTIATVASWHATVIPIGQPLPPLETAPTALTWISIPVPPPPPPPVETAPTSLSWRINAQ